MTQLLAPLVNNVGCSFHVQPNTPEQTSIWTANQKIPNPWFPQLLDGRKTGNCGPPEQNAKILKQFENRAKQVEEWTKAHLNDWSWLYENETSAHENLAKYEDTRYKGSNLGASRSIEHQHQNDIENEELPPTDAIDHSQQNETESDQMESFHDAMTSVQTVEI